MKYDIGYITNYIIEYDSGVPMSVILGLSLIVCAIIVTLYHYSTDGFIFLRKTSWCILGGYMSFIFCATVLFRDHAEEIRYSWPPFLTYACLYNRRIAEIILNVLMFIPIGFLLTAVLKKNFLLVFCIGCLLSIIIEVIQLLTYRGVCNIDDVIHNTLGCVLGYSAFRICNSILTAYTK